MLSCPFDDDTANIDALAAVQDEYAGDLEIEVWGAEQLSSRLRPAVELLTAMLGQDWARQWCGDDSVARARDAAKAKALAIAALTATMNVQFKDDNDVRFRQIELTGISVEALFVDVPATTDPGSAAEDLLRRINPPPDNAADRAGHDAPALAGAAQVLLHPDWTGSAVIVGGPGQGKSTLLQYLCQYYRARLLGIESYSPIAAGLEPVTKVDRTPIRIDLTDYAQWRRHQISHTTAQTVPATAAARVGRSTPAHAGLVPYLAAVVAETSRTEFTAQDLAIILTSRPTLLALDGLDEVADPDEREDITAEIRISEALLRTDAYDISIIVATRPGVVSDPIWRSSQFVPLYLAQLTDGLRMKYLDRWTAQSKLSTMEKRELRTTFTDSIVRPHVRELAGNPMQLAILLHLMQRRAVLPDKRTLLYGSYIDVFMDREAAKSPVVATYQDLVLKFHKLLAWHIHSQVELGASNGSIGIEQLETMLTVYLTARGFDADVINQLFKSVTGRVLCLVEREYGSGEFQFEVQPLREYFAAEHAYDCLPSTSKDNTRPACLAVLLRRPFWSNVTRFYAGRFTSGEVPSIIIALRGMRTDRRTGAHPLDRQMAKLLLDDQVFAGQPVDALADLVRVIVAGTGQVFAVDGLIAPAGRDLSFAVHGGRAEAAAIVVDCLATETTPAGSAGQLLRHWGAREAASESWWAKRELVPPARWLDVATDIGALSGLTPEQASVAEAMLLGDASALSLLERAVASSTDLVTDSLLEVSLAQLRSGWAGRVPLDPDTHHGRLVLASSAQRYYEHRRGLESPTRGDTHILAAPRPRRSPKKLRSSNQAWATHIDALNSAHDQRSSWTDPRTWHRCFDQVATLWGIDCWALREPLLALPEFAIPVVANGPDFCEGSSWRPVAAWLGEAAEERRNPRWWVEQFDAARSNLEKLTAVVAALTLANSNTVTAIAPQLESAVGCLSVTEWAVASAAVARYRAGVASARALNLSDALRTGAFNPSARLAVLVWARATGETRTRLVPVIIAALSTLWGCGSSLRDIGREVIAAALKPVEVTKLRGARADLPPAHLDSSMFKPFTLEMAEQILTEPHAWPTAVVTSAVERLTTRFEKLPPVAEVAVRDRWGV